jgi:cellobiose transport system permease protein
MAAVSPTSGAVVKAPRGRARYGYAGGQQHAGKLVYILIGIITIISIFPLYWMLVVGSHTNAEMAQSPPPIYPTGDYFHNLALAMHRQDLWQALLNSTIVSIVVAASNVFFCTLAGFAFAKLHFRGSNVLLMLVIGTLTVPLQISIVPLFMLAAKYHMVGHLQAAIAPYLVSAFGVFLMRQYLLTALPTELVEAGWVDGASTFRIFRSIVLPAARPAMAVLAMLQFLFAWNDFFWPLLVLNTRNPTVQVALAGMGTGYIPQTGVIMAATFFVTLPVVVAFLFLGKQIVGGIMQGAVKG